MLVAAAVLQTCGKELLKLSELREGWEVSPLYWETAAVTQQFLPLS